MISNLSPSGHLFISTSRLSSILAWCALLATILFGSFQNQALAQEPAPGGENSYDSLRRGLEEKILAFGWGQGRISAIVMDVEHDIVVFQRNADELLPPGSIMKAFLSAAALDQLGPGFQFSTELLSTGEVKRRTLKGALVVRGSGDPTLSASYSGRPDDLYVLFDHWAKVLKKEKIRNVDGPLYVDATAFDRDPFAPGWPLENLGESTIPEVSALNFNDNCIDIYWKAGKKAGRIAEQYQLPDLPEFIFFSNNVRIEEAGRTEVRFRRQEGSRVINASGTLALNVERHDRIAVHAPERFFGEALKARLAKKGIRISGRVLPLPADGTRGNEIGELRLLDTGLSPPLQEILATMGQYDRNLDADVVFKTLGRRSAQRPGSFRTGAKAVMDFVRANGMRASGMVVLDGSGLSELNRVSPRQVMSLFKTMRTHPEREAFEACFAKAGNPGVQEDRFLSGLREEADSVAPVACLSGITRGAVSLAGWAHSLPGYPVHFVFSIVGSTLPGSVLIEQLDALAMEITRSTIRS